MKIDPTDYGAIGTIEAEILTGIIINDTVAGRASAAYDGDPDGPFTVPLANRVFRWCHQHYRRYRKAIGRGIKAHCDEWSLTHKNDQEKEQVNQYLERLNNDYARLKKAINPAYLTDLASRQFRENRLRRLRDRLTAELDARRLDEAETAVTRYATVDLAAASGTDLFLDPAAMLRTYAKDTSEPLITYPGGLGEFFGNTLCRDHFVAMMAPEKGFKSWMLLDIAYRAMLARRRVAYFQAGDLSEAQINDRFLVRAVGAPSFSTAEDGVTWPCKVRWPVSIDPPGPGEDHARVKFKAEKFAKPFHAEVGWEVKLKDRLEKLTRSRRSFFKLQCHPTRTISAAGIRAAVDAYVLSGWVPDVVVIDYADILAPIDKREDPIHQIKTTWEELRKLNQAYHCLLVTATQVNAAAYTKRTLDRSNFSGNHLKLAEVTEMIGINSTVEEKENQILRLNYVSRRHAGFNSRRCVHVAGCVALSSPCVESVYPRWNPKPTKEG